MERMLVLMMLAAVFAGCATTPPAQRALHNEPAAVEPESAGKDVAVLTASESKEAKEAQKDAAGPPAVAAAPAPAVVAAPPVRPTSTSEKAPEAPRVATAPSAKKSGILARGYAVVQGDVGRAKAMAILYALSVAFQEKCSADIARPGIGENVLLKTKRIGSQFAAYKVVDESQKDGLYCVKLRVTFDDALLKGVVEPKVGILVGGRETVAVASRQAPGDTARKAVADALSHAGVRVAAADGEIPSANALAELARTNRNDLALYVAAESKQFDKFGQFYSFKTGIDYQLVMAANGEVVVGGHVEGVNKERPLTAEDAASQSLRDVGQTASREILQKLTSRYDRAVSHTVYAVGISNEKQAGALVADLGVIPGVKSAHVLASEKGICAVAMTLSPESRSAVPGALQGLRNTKLDIVESDPYTTVAKVR